MKKRILAILMACLMIASIFIAISVSAINVERRINEEANKTINNEDQPIQAIIEVEQNDGRS